MPKLSHLNNQGDAEMVDISSKAVSKREATAETVLQMQPETLDLVFSGEIPKGDVIAVARIAGIQAAKKTSELIPLCHPLPLEKIKVGFYRLSKNELRIETTCTVSGKTGVEMEALTATSVAALTIYDMCKAVDRGIEIRRVRLLAKSGGKSGTWTAI